jgi:hypothetical protein
MTNNVISIPLELPELDCPGQPRADRWAGELAESSASSRGAARGAILGVLLGSAIYGAGLILLGVVKL